MSPALGRNRKKNKYSDNFDSTVDKLYLGKFYLSFFTTLIFFLLNPLPRLEGVDFLLIENTPNLCWSILFKRTSLEIYNENYFKIKFEGLTNIPQISTNILFVLPKIRDHLP